MGLEKVCLVGFAMTDYVAAEAKNISSIAFSFFESSFSNILTLVFSFTFSSLNEFDCILSLIASSYRCSFSLRLLLVGFILLSLDY